MDGLDISNIDCSYNFSNPISYSRFILFNLDFSQF